jgi:hypothetical protein
MKPRNVVIPAIVLIAALAWMIPHYRGTQRRKLREARYQTTLTSYSSELKPGMTRKEVEDLLRQKDIHLVRMLFQGPTLDDFINIGQERLGWPCSKEEVNIQLHFTPQGANREGAPNDILKDITLIHWPLTCL